MVLVDTSVWIEIFRKPARLKLDAVADLDEIVTALPIVQEVLQGFADEAAFRTARDAMLALPVAESPLTVDRFVEAAQLYRAARRAGLTIRWSTDCLIAACAIRHDAIVAHVDRDYDHIAKVSPLRSRRVVVNARG
jgi:predicted nucleic acid-binding protein